MLLRLSIAASLSLALAIPQQVCASPITFDFTGTGGVSGPFTINGNPASASGSYLSWPANAGWYSVLTEGGSDVSLTVNIGGKAIHFANSPSDTSSSAWATLGASIPAPGWGTSLAELMVGGNSAQASFGLSFYAPLANISLHDLSTFGLSPNLVIGPSEWTVSYPGGGGVASSGTLTSLTLVSTPSPARSSSSRLSRSRR